MANIDVWNGEAQAQCHQHDASVYCDLFNDRVAERVCLLLKKELNDWWRCDAFCRGCNRR